MWWGMARFTCDALAVTSELVTNAIKASWAHSCATVAVWLWADDRQLLIEVWDSAPGVPSPVVAIPEGEGGRGLAVVAALSKSWGYYPDVRRGKTVWARLAEL